MPRRCPNWTQWPYFTPGRWPQFTLGLTAQYDTLLFPVYLAPILDGRSFADALKTFMQADGIHPNKAGVGLIVPVIGPYVVDLVGKIE